MNKVLIIGFLILVVQIIVAQEVIATLILEDTKVELIAYRSDKPGYVFFNMHDNENTGVEAARKVIKKEGGVLYELVHSGERYIEFNYKTQHIHRLAVNGTIHK